MGTHTMVTPLDLVKCRLQVDKEKYKNLGNGFKLTMQEGGLPGLFLGWAPTAIGYSAQGLCKFGFYEVFKKLYADAMGEENAYLYMTGLYLAASASAEFFADIDLSRGHLPHHPERSLPQDHGCRGHQWLLQVPGP